MMLMVECLFFLIGLNVCISAGYWVRNFILSMRANKSLTDYGRGSWCLITACTGGIGQGFTIALAKQGFNIVQVSRNPEKLAATAADLQSKYGVQVRNIVKDFVHAPENPIDFYKDLSAQTKDLDISIVINNVGTVFPGKFLEISLQNVLDQIALDLFPICFISNLYLSGLCNRPQGGALINLSSTMSQMILSKHILYCSSKAFDYALTAVIESEVRVNKDGAKIDVLSLHPGAVDTPMTKNTKGKFLEIDIHQCAEAGLRCLGSTSVTHGHTTHLIADLIFKVLRIASPFL